MNATAILALTTFIGVAIAQPGLGLRSIAAHNGDVLGVFIDEANSRVATCGIDGTIKLWSIPSLELLCTYTGHQSTVNNISFSGNDKFLASVSNDRSVRIWNTHTCNAERILSGHRGEVLCVYFSQIDTGTFVATGSADRTVKIWDWQTGAEIKTLRGHTGAVMGIAYSYDGQYIASCGDDMQLLVWSTEPSEYAPRITLTGPPHIAPCTTVLFSFDGNLLASADREGYIKIWSIPQGRLLRTIDAHSGYVSDLTFAGDNTTLISTGHDGAVYVWNAHTGELRDSISINTAIWSLDVTSDGSQVLIGCTDGTLRLWNRLHRQPYAPPRQKKRP